MPSLKKTVSLLICALVACSCSRGGSVKQPPPPAMPPTPQARPIPVEMLEPTNAELKIRGVLFRSESKPTQKSAGSAPN